MAVELTAGVNGMKRIVGPALCAVLLIAALSVSAFGYSVASCSPPGDSDRLICNSGGLYRIGFCSGDLYAERITPDRRRIDLPLPYPVAAAHIFGDTAVALCNDIPNDQVVVYTYGIGTGMFDSFAIPHCSVSYDCDFLYDGGGIYLQDDSRLSVIRRYSVSGQLVDSHDFQSGSLSLIAGYGSDLYVAVNRSLYRVYSGAYSRIDGVTPHKPTAFIADGYLMDSSGDVYRINGGAGEYLLTAETDGKCIGALSADGHLYSACGQTISRYDISSGRRTDYCELPAAIAALCVSDGTAVAVSEGSSSSVYRITASDFIPCPEEQPSVAGFPIGSGVYTVDAVRLRITRITAPTTFAQFKRNMQYDGFTALLYRDGKRIESGNVGTAMTVVFSGIDSYAFELSVVGDITGEGNVNSRDVNELEDYFLDNIRFDGVYSDAADVSGDGEVDLIDLALLCRAAK